MDLYQASNVNYCTEMPHAVTHGLCPTKLLKPYTCTCNLLTVKQSSCSVPKTIQIKPKYCLSVGSLPEGAGGFSATPSQGGGTLYAVGGVKDFCLKCLWINKSL